LINVKGKLFAIGAAWKAFPIGSIHVFTRAARDGHRATQSVAGIPLIRASMLTRRD
jgi:hypothetical protein